MKIMIGCPVHNRAWILPYFLEHLYNLNYDKTYISLYFLLNNCTDNSEEILVDFKNKNKDKYNSVKIEKYKSKYDFEDNRTNHVRINYTYYHLSDLRNHLLTTASKSDCDYLLSVDSDILLQPDSLTKLLSANKDICAGIIYNGHIVSPQEPYKYPNILKFDSERKGYIHIRNWYVKNAPTLTEPRIIEVDASGAIILMSKEVTQKTKYKWHHQGEDMSWSKDCQDKGFKLHCDLSAFNYHIMTKDMLKEYIIKHKGEAYEI